MTATIRSEWIKLHTVTVHWVLFVIAVAFPILVVTLVALFGSEVETIRGDELAELITGTSLISAMLLGSVAAISLTSEYSFGTIRPTFAATPSRLRVMIAKLVINTVVAALVAAAVVATCWVAASVIIDGRDGSVSLSVDDGSLGALVALVVLAAILTWFAFGIGLIVRNSPATVSILLLWPLIAENLVGALLSALGQDGLVRWLPYQAGITTIAADPEGDALGRPGGWIWFGLVSLTLVVVGLVLSERRDA